MSPRRARIGKVVTVREKELDKRVAALSDRRAAEAQALSQEERRKLELEQASESRMKLAEEREALDAHSWIEANEWLQSRRRQHEMARLEAAKAQVATKQAHGEVMHARSNLKKLELLAERIQKQEAGEAQRLERRLEDELSALRFRRSGDDRE